jgi:tetratricopeptide (TPR) repeat protein
MRIRQGLVTLVLALAVGCGSTKKKPDETKPEPEQAAKPTEAIPAKDTAEADRLCAEGKKAEDAGNFSAARDSYVAALKADRDHKEATSRLDGLDDVVSAQGELDKNGASAPDRKAALEVSLGDALRKRGDDAKASAHYRAAVDLKPDTATAHVGLATVSVEEGLFGDALASYTRAVEADPQCAQAHYELAFLNRTSAVEGATAAKALEHARKAAELQPTNAAFLEMLAECSKDAGEMEKAVQALEEAVRNAGKGKDRLEGKLKTWKEALGGGGAKPPEPKPAEPAPSEPKPAEPGMGGDAPK